MYLQKLEIENIRGFAGGAAKTAITLPEAGWCVFAGRNGSGKTTLLRAAAVGMVGEHHAPALVGSFAGWIRSGGKNGTLKVYVAAGPRDTLSSGTNDALNGELELKHDGPLVGETWSWEPPIDGAEKRDVLERQGAREDSGIRRASWARDPNGWLVVGYGAHRRLGRDGDGNPAFSTISSRLESLFSEESTLVDSVNWLKYLKFRALEKREGAAEQLEQVIELLNDDLLPDGAQIVEVGSQGVFVEARGVKLELGQLSDGYRGALALLVDLLRHIFSAYGTFDFERRHGRLVSTASAVVLIDEVEAHLHVSWQQKIGFWLTERFPKVQFLVTTHSPFICQAAHPEGLFLLPAPGEEGGVELADSTTYNRVVNGSVDDAVLSNLFGLEHSKSERTIAKEQEWASLRMQSLEAPLDTVDAERKRELERELPFPFDALSKRP